MTEDLRHYGPVLDLERFQRERDSYLEAWSTPVEIQFGAVFEDISGGVNEPYYGLSMVYDILRGNGFKIMFLIGTEVDGQYREYLEGGGDALKTNILRMTGRILSVGEYMERQHEAEAEFIRRWGKKRVRRSGHAEPDWTAIEQRALIQAQKGSRILEGYNPKV